MFDRGMAIVTVVVMVSSAEAGTIVGSEANVYTINEIFGAPLDLVVSVVNDGGTTQHAITEAFVNATGLDWMGFQHRIGFGVGEAWALIPNGTGIDFDGPHTSDVFDVFFAGDRKIDWWVGDAPDGTSVQFDLSISIPDSTSIPLQFHTADGYTFTLRHYPSVPPPPMPPGWWRGNTHTHSNLSHDSGDPPADVAAFYRDLGYDFLVLTDHSWNKVSGDMGWSDFSAYSTPDFLCISGEEVTHSTNHTNGLGTSVGIIAGTLAENVENILAQGAVPHVCHPGPGVPAANILAVADLAHMEIYNAFIDHGTMYTAKWDVLLSAGKTIWGVASDDSHIFPEHAGKGWIVVRSDSLDETSILGAIEIGDFYASSGITLTDLVVDSQGICIGTANGERIRFIGEYGTLLASIAGPDGVYQFTGQEAYVRAEVSNSYQQMAWTQPVFDTCPWDCALADGVVDVSDLIALLAQFGAPGTCDFDQSGVVNVLDILTLLSHFDPDGIGCP